MRLLLLALLLLLCTLPTHAQAPPLSARWDGPGRATLRWNGPGCLYRVPSGQAGILIGCYRKDVSYTLELGHTGPLDAALRPAGGDTYVLWRDDGGIERAALRSVTYLPAFY